MTNYSDAAIRVPAVLVSEPKYGLLLRFMLNPNELTSTKDPTYEARTIPGWRSPVRWWSGGQEKVLTFSGFWDKTDSRNTGGVNLFTPPTPAVGLRDVIAVVESFLEPKTPADIVEFRQLPQAVRNLMSLPSAYLPPPVAFLVWGTRIWKCIVLSAPIQEMKYDAILNPSQIEVQFRLGVIDEGEFHKIYAKERAGLALVASGLAGIDLIPELFGDILPGLLS